MICVSVQEKSFGDCRAILESCEMADLRADLCRLSVEEVERLVEIRPNLIATCRIANSSETFAREQLEAAIRRGARYVDIEIEAPDEHLEYIRTLAREYGCRLIVSFHDFEGTPSLDELKGIARLCRTKGADLVKIGTTARNISDAARTMRLYDLQADGALFEGAAAAERPQLVAFSMGEAGKFTRLLCLKLGAPYTYVSAGASNATATGQYTREEMERLLSAENYPFEGFREFRRTTVAVPCSKSVAQRAVLAAALAAGESRLANYAPCNDIVGAVEVIRGMGCRIASDGTTLHIEGVGAERLGRCSKIETGESGLLTRLLTPLASHISALNGGAPVEISGHGSILKRNLHEAVAALREAGNEVIELSGVTPTPRLDKVLEGVKLVKEHGVSQILAVGGGTVIGCAKFISLGSGLGEDEDLWDDYVETGKPAPENLVPLGVVLTTAATGSEMGDAAELTNWARNRKLGYTSFPLTPKFSVLDPT